MVGSWEVKVKQYTITRKRRPERPILFIFIFTDSTQTRQRDPAPTLSLPCSPAIHKDGKKLKIPSSKNVHRLITSYKLDANMKLWIFTSGNGGRPVPEVTRR